MTFVTFLKSVRLEIVFPQISPENNDVEKRRELLPQGHVSLKNGVKATDVRDHIRYFVPGEKVLEAS